ncbi:MAG: hypothetical protein Q4D62_09460 [Planctomycetia bacterium]|nr:hypothetical protein [Planctomycetia bacterium]
MSEQTPQTIFSQIDVSNVVSSPQTSDQETLAEKRHSEMMLVLREILAQQRRQSDLLFQMLNFQTAASRQRTQELQKWRQAHPQLSKGCREILSMLEGVQTEYYTRIVEEAEEKGEDMVYSEFLFNEFVDRFGPRLMHLNGLLQLLTQLSSPEP